MGTRTYWNHDWAYQKAGETKRSGRCTVRHQSLKAAMNCAERKFTKNNWLDWNGAEYGEANHLDGHLSSGYVVREVERQYTVPGSERFREILK